MKGNGFRGRALGGMDGGKLLLGCVVGKKESIFNKNKNIKRIKQIFSTHWIQKWVAIDSGL